MNYETKKLFSVLPVMTEMRFAISRNLSRAAFCFPVASTFDGNLLSIVFRGTVVCCLLGCRAARTGLVLTMFIRTHRVNYYIQCNAIMPTRLTRIMHHRTVHSAVYCHVAARANGSDSLLHFYDLHCSRRMERRDSRPLLK